MSSAQTWTVIGGFFAILVAVVGLVLALVRAEITVLRVEMNTRFDSLERDLQRLYEHTFSRQGESPAA